MIYKIPGKWEWPGEQVHTNELSCSNVVWLALLDMLWEVFWQRAAATFPPPPQLGIKDRTAHSVAFASASWTSWRRGHKEQIPASFPLSFCSGLPPLPSAPFLAARGSTPSLLPSLQQQALFHSVVFPNSLVWTDRQGEGDNVFRSMLKHTRNRRHPKMHP